MAAMLMVSFSFGQIETKTFRQENVKLEPRPAFLHSNSSKNAASEEWFNYVNTIYANFASEPTGDNYAVGRVAVDSNGLTYYSDGTTGHGFFFGWGQTYDFNHTVWDDNAVEGEISMANTNSYNIDSVAILGHYNRGAYVPTTAVDTLIVGITTAIEDDDLVQLSVNDGAIIITRFYGVEYDPATGLQKYATIYKLPLTASDVAEVNPETDGIYPAYYILPVNLTNISNKLLNITYTLKRDDSYTVPMDSNIKDYSYFYAWLAADPREDYFPHNGSGWFQPEDDILNNQNQGTIVQEDNLIYSNPSAWYCKYLYPATIWNANTSYPDISFKVSCNDCAIVNVPELEKNNPTVYPNPATNNFTVDLGNDEKANIQLFNLVGQQVYSETITGRAQVSVANLHSGVYMLKVNQNGNVYTTKVVVK